MKIKYKSYIVADGVRYRFMFNEFGLIRGKIGFATTLIDDVEFHKNYRLL